MMGVPEWLTVGDIVKPQGLDGEIRVKTRTDFPEIRLAPNRELMLFHPNLTEPRLLTVESSRPQKGVYVVKFVQFDAIDEVEPLRGGSLKIAVQDAHSLDMHEYYFHEIIGCHVRTEDGLYIGQVKEILQPGANDVWVVQRQKSDKDLYLPYIAQVVKKVDPEKKQIVIRWLAGLE